MPKVLREDPLIAARQYRHRACANPAKFSQPGGIFKNVDRLELNPTDREKLFEFQTTRSTRLPERFQLHDVDHDGLLILPIDYEAGEQWSRPESSTPPLQTLWRLDCRLAGPIQVESRLDSKEKKFHQ
jgi:hypothetical protein